MASIIKRTITKNCDRHLRSLSKRHALVNLLVDYGRQGSFWRKGSLLKTRTGSILLTNPTSICTVDPSTVQKVVYTISRG